MSTVHRLLLSAWLSYRALFTWLNPWGYLGTRVVAPIAITLLFGALGQDTAAGAAHPVLGGALLAITLAGVYGMALAVNNERTFGTLELRIATPEGLLSSLVGKAIPHIVDGLLGGTLTFVTAAAVFGVDIPASRTGPFLAVGLTAGLSGVAIGLLAAAIGVSTRDTFTAPNVLDVLLTLVSGVFVAADRLPWGIDGLSMVLPLRRSVDAGLAVLDGQPTPWVLLAHELAVGLAWGLCGYALLRSMIVRARRTGSLQLL